MMGKILWVLPIISIVGYMKWQEYRAKNEGLVICNKKGYSRVEIQREGFREFRYGCSEPIPITPPLNKMP